MIDYENPFEYEAASKFTEEQIVDFYIEDFNYSRFIRSKRNIMLIGERGTGKTMTLLYNSFPVQFTRIKNDSRINKFDLICIYIPCNTALTHKKEYELIENFSATVISEHFLVVSIMYNIVDTLSKINNLINENEQKEIIEQLSFIFDYKTHAKSNFFDWLKLNLDKEVINAQKSLNSKELYSFYDNAYTFSSGVIPLMKCFKKCVNLKDTHFSLLIDDAHDLNEYQIRVLNSWIAYRENTFFSFKIASAKIDKPSSVTSSGGTILEGHDFTVIDMEQPYQNKYSNFGKLAEKIVKKRLEKVGILKEPREFFPINKKFYTDLKKCERNTKEIAKTIYINNEKKKINDYVYKYARAEYFRNRAAQANLPPYSGFETLVHISTGVIRNLLEPCFWMYDKAYSSVKDKDSKKKISVDFISPQIQNDIILENSKKKWEWIKDGLDKSIEGCSTLQAKQIYQLFNNLAVLFRERLLKHKTEPRAIAFTISERNSEIFESLMDLIRISRKAQILYVYTSSAKDLGKREEYYVPNRILWPERGLDPIGQHARVSIKSSVLWNAAAYNKNIPFVKEIDDKQRELFNG